MTGRSGLRPGQCRLPARDVDRADFLARSRPHPPAGRAGGRIRSGRRAAEDSRPGSPFCSSASTSAVPPSISDWIGSRGRKELSRLRPPSPLSPPYGYLPWFPRRAMAVVGCCEGCALGVIRRGIYLYDFPLQRLVVWEGVRYPWVALGVTLPAGTACGHASWQLVERFDPGSRPESVSGYLIDKDGLTLAGPRCSSRTERATRWYGRSS